MVFDGLLFGLQVGLGMGIWGTDGFWKVIWVLNQGFEEMDVGGVGRGGDAGCDCKGFGDGGADGVAVAFFGADWVEGDLCVEEEGQG